jgi:hypothetical protein
MSGWCPQRRGTARTLPNFCVALCIFVLFCEFFCVVLCNVCFVTFPVLFVCICVLNNCQRVATKLQLNISYHIIYVYIIINTQLARCFRYSKPSSDQFLLYRHGAFSECAHYGLPYCSQSNFIFKIRVKNLLADVSFGIYVKTSISTLVNPYLNLMLTYTAVGRLAQSV